MEAEIVKFLKKRIKDQRSKISLNDLIELVSKQFSADLEPSDRTFIKQQFRTILADLWALEVIENIEMVIKTEQIGDDVIIELVGIFQSLRAFENTPKYLQGDFHKAILKEYAIFTPKDFLKARREICNILSHKIMCFSQNVRNEYRLFTNLIDVLRNSNKSFDSVASKLNLHDFVTGKISLFQVSQNICNFNFDIDKYNALREASVKIENSPSVIQHVLKREIGKYLVKLISKETRVAGKKVWLLQRKAMTSDDLNVNFDMKMEEVHVVCDILHIDQNLPLKYHGKNVFVLANTIRLHEHAIWNLSGYDGRQMPQNAGQYSNGDGKNGKDGESGSSGGNCEIFSAEINNASFWTIKSNGGNGSNGQDGGDGMNGDDGHDVIDNDFSLNGTKLTNSNFIQLLYGYGISTQNGSRRCEIYENYLQKQIIFNRDDTKSELLMLIKGSSGKIGGLGGFGGYGDNGGYAGKINIHSDDKGVEVIAINGRDGLDGSNGLNGRKGRDGRDECIKISSLDDCPSYGRFPKSLTLQTSPSGNEKKYSIFYKPFNRNFYILSNRRIDEQNLYIRNSPDQHEFVLNKNEESFYEIFKTVVRNANKKMSKFIKDTNANEFINKNIDFKQFASLISTCYIDIPYYDILKIYADLYSVRSSNLETPVRKFLREYTTEAKIINKSGSTYEIKKKLLTTEDLNDIRQDFNDLNVICDVLHVNSNLSEKFRGKNLAIIANTINIHKSVTWDFSGCDNFLAIKDSGRRCFENGGHCIINCNTFNNPSLLKIITNGGDASQARNGIDAKLDNFKISGRNVEDLASSINRSTIDEGLMKHLVKQSDTNYILLVKGSSAIPAYNGIGEKSGIPGTVDINTKENASKYEIEVSRKNGNDDISHDGRDLVLYVKNGQKNYFGYNDYNKYDLMSSIENLGNSVYSSSKYYYPKFSRSIKEVRGPCCNGQAIYESILWTLRNSFAKIETIVAYFKLKEFANGYISLADVARAINSNSYKISFPDANHDDRQFYADLKSCAKNFKKSKHEDRIRSKINDLIKPADQRTSSTVLTIKKNFYLSSYLNSLSITSNITEIRLICYTLYIDSELPKSFRGKNFAINANYVKVGEAVTWDLSGTPVYGGFSSNAGQKPNGTGRDGENGKAGNSSGNFLLHCKIIENSSALTIVSNGSNGTDGQDGGNGKDGEHGIHADERSVYRNNVKWGAFFDGSEQGNVCRAFNLYGKHFVKDYSGEVETDDGLRAHVYIDQGACHRHSLILVKGSDGEPGQPGGLAGYGGQGGYPGEIHIKSTDAAENVQKFRKHGNDGKSGNPGYDGIHGNEGRDIWMYDQSSFKEAHRYGFSYRYKYELSYTDREREDSIETSSGSYVKPVYARLACTYTAKDRYRNKSKNNRQRKYQAMSKKSSSISMSSIISEHSSFMSDSKLNLQHKSSTQTMSRESEFNAFKHSSNIAKTHNESYFHTDSHKATNKCELRKCNKSTVNKTSDILAEMIASEYSDYLKTSTSEIDEIMDKYKNVKMEIEEEETQVQTEISVQVKFEGNRNKNSNLSVNSDKISHRSVQDMLISGCDAENIFKALQRSKFSFEEYKNLIDHVNKYKMEQNLRNCQDEKTIIDKSIKKYFKRLLSDKF